MGAQQKILLVDGHSLAYTSLFAQESLSVDIQGTKVFTGIPYGFLRTVLSLCREHDIDSVKVCWDGGSARKKAVYPEYKKDRKEIKFEDMTFEDMLLSMKYCRKIMQLAGVEQFRVKGEEGDDLIYSYVAQNPDKVIVVTSSDHDLFQVLKYPNTTFLRLHKEHTKLWTRPEFVDEYGFEPRFYGQYLAIVGCKGDDVPGIKGVGPKAAAKVFKALPKPTIGNIYASLDTLDMTDKTRDKFRDNKDKVAVFLAVTKLRKDIQLAPIMPGTTDRTKLTQILTTLAFRSILINENDMELLCNIA